MFSIKHAPLLLATILAFSAHNVHAHQSTETNSATHLAPITIQTLPTDPEELYRYKIIEKTKNMFTLLGAEIAFNQGKNEIALNTYLATLFKTQDPEVAERAMELAINLHEYDIAEQIYKQWQTIEPQSSPAQRRIAWARSFALGNTDAIVSGLKSVLNEANEDQIRRIFLLLAQNSSNHQLAIQSNATIQEAVQRYPNMNEAIIASMLFSSSVGNRPQAQATLKHLVTTDPQLSSQTRIALDLAFLQDSQLLIDFFKDNNKDLPIAWKKFAIEVLAEAGKKDLAYQQLQTLLNTYSDADLYIQAGLWSYQQNANIQVTLNYLAKAFQLGTPTQKSRAATLSAIRLLTDHRYTETEHWLSFINSTENAFDKIILQISMAIEQEKWAEADHFIQQANKMINKQGLFFNNSDLQQLKTFVIMQNNDKIKHSIAELTRTINHIEQQKNNNNTSDLAQALYQRGLLYSTQSRQFNRAVADLRHFLRLYPNNSTGMNALGYILLERPEYLNEAYELIKKAYQQEPESAQINDSLGWAYMKKGDAQTALPYLQYAYQQNADAEVSAHLGETYWALGDQSKANQIWQEAWNKNKKNRILNDTLKKYGIHF